MDVTERLRVSVIDGGDEMILAITLPDGAAAAFGCPHDSVRAAVLWKLRDILERGQTKQESE